MVSLQSPARLALIPALTIFLLVGVGCDDNGGDGPDGAAGVLFLSAAARHPDLIADGQRIGLAIYLAQLKLDSETAASLAQVARDEGPELRAVVDEQFELLGRLVGALSDSADQFVVADTPEQVLFGIVTQPEFAEIMPHLGEDNPMNLAVHALRVHRDLVSGLATNLELEDAARISGMTTAVRRCLWSYQSRHAAGEQALVAMVDEILPLVTGALGYDPEQDDWAAEAARPIVYAWVAQDEGARQQSLDIAIQRLLVEVRPVEDVMVEQVSDVFLVIATHEDAPELLDAIAAKGA